MMRNRRLFHAPASTGAAIARRLANAFGGAKPSVSGISLS
jgi:hypothetical protein